MKGRSKSAIRTQARKLGLCINRPWTEEENNIFKKYYPTEGVDVAARLKGRSKSAIRTQARKLGLKCNKWKNTYKYVYKKKNKYSVKFRVNGKDMRFGTFDTEEDARKVALQKAKEYGKAI